MNRIALISAHTSPLAQPGSGDSGGMNVYVRELASSLAQAGCQCTVYTRADAAGLAPEVLIEPGYRVVHIEAGPHHLPKEALCEVMDEFTDAVAADIVARGGVDAIHAHYWLSGLAGHRLKHELGVPFVMTFHTLARVKAAGGDPDVGLREIAELEIINCADAISVSCAEEERQFRALHPEPVGRFETIAPGVHPAFFSPGDRAGARAALGLDPDRPLVVFVGRIQPLKGPDLAVRTMEQLTELGYGEARLLIIGGSSGADHHEVQLHELVDELGLSDRVDFVQPQPHHTLSSYYRAADVVMVPSRSESFGLVALEAAACGIPVVASAVGGLLSLVDHGRTGFVVTERNPRPFAEAIAMILDDPDRAQAMGRAALEHSEQYRWGLAAARARRLYLELAAREPVACL